MLFLSAFRSATVETFKNWQRLQGLGFYFEKSNMFYHSPKINLAPSKTLELVRLQLQQAHDSKDPEITLIICNFADSLLASLKSVVKRPPRVTSSSGPIHNVDPDQESLLCQEIASAYLEHANLMADLGHADMAQNSRKRADKWG